MDSGAAVSLIHHKHADGMAIQEGRRVDVEDFCGNPRTFDEWCEVLNRIDDEARTLSFLVVDGLKYDMLVSRRAMKDFKMNLHDDTVSFANAYERRLSLRAKAQLKQGLDAFNIETMEDIGKFPDFIPGGHISHSVSGTGEKIRGYVCLE